MLEKKGPCVVNSKENLNLTGKWFITHDQQITTHYSVGVGVTEFAVVK